MQVAVIHPGYEVIAYSTCSPSSLCGNLHAKLEPVCVKDRLKCECEDSWRPVFAGNVMILTQVDCDCEWMSHFYVWAVPGF